MKLIKTANLLLVLTLAACADKKDNTIPATSVADSWVGNYNTNDTVTYTAGGNTFVTPYAGSATFYKISDARIGLVNFPYGNYCDSPKADVTTAAMSLVTDASCQSSFFGNFSLTRNSSTLTYTYTYNNPGSPVFSVRERAVKQ